MTKVNLLPEVNQYGSDASFVANLIMTRHGARVSKMKGLLRLLRAGFTIRVSQFDCDRLLMNGSPISWQYLERLGAETEKQATHMLSEDVT